MDALNAGDKLEKIWIDKMLRGELEREVRFLTRKHQIPLQYVPKEKLRSLTSNANHQGLVALASIVEYLSIQDVLPHIYESGKTPCILVLDGIEDVRNIGALARSAVWFGMDAIVTSLKKSARINSFAMKASAGALKDITVCREKSISEAIKYMKASGLQMIVADSNQENEKADADNNLNYSEPIALILGSEYDGVSKALLPLADATMMIPGTKKVDSLNVSTAGAILMYELFKNRSNK